MNWNVTYRGQGGDRVVACIEAESRDALFKSLAIKGISPIRIEEAKGGKSGDFKKRRPVNDRTGLRFSPIAIVGCAVLLVAAFSGMWWWLGDRETTTLPVEKPTKPKIVQPPQRPVTPAPKANTKPLTKEERRAAQLQEIRDKFGDNIPESLKATVYFLEHPPQKGFKVRSNADFLRHSSERMLAGVALVEPGTYFVVKPEFGESFDQDFLNALIDKIDINDDDSEETIAVKQGVSDLKKEIADICKREGKKPSEVMNEHAATMYELGRYQRDLEDELERIHANEEYSDKDVEDFCTAANELLKSKGLPPMQHLDLTRRSFMIKSLQKMAERKAAREKEREEAK